MLTMTLPPINATGRLSARVGRLLLRAVSSALLVFGIAGRPFRADADPTPSPGDRGASSATVLAGRATPSSDLLASSDQLRADAAARTREGALLGRRGEYAAALASLTRALALRERVGEASATASALRALGLVHEQAGAYLEARDEQARALRLSEASGDAAGSAAALGNLGGLHFRAGEYAASLKCQERALALLDNLGDHRRVAATLCNLGVLYQRIGDGDRAIAYFVRALAGLDGAGDEARRSTVLANAGALEASRGESRKALKHLEESRHVAEGAGDRAGVALALTNEGYVQVGLGNCVEAQRAQERALAIYEALGDRDGTVDARTALGLVEAAKGASERALAFLRGSVEDAEANGAQDALVVALWATASVRWQAGEPIESMIAARRAILEMPSMVGGLSEEHGALARQRLAPVFETGLRAAAAAGDVEQATFFLESGRAGALLEALGGRERLHELVVPRALREAERRARVAEASALARYRQALDTDDLKGARAGRADYEDARQGVKVVIERIQRESKAAAQLVYPRAASLAELRAGLAKNEALVTFATFSDRTLALVVTRAGARLVPLGSAAELEASCRGLEVLSSPGSETTDAVTALRRLIVEPLELPSSVKRVLVSPDGALAYVPFALLFEGRQVACVQSGTTWQLLDGDGEKRGEGVLALGDPAYQTDGDGANQLARMQSGVGFAPLAYTREEATAVGDVVLLGADATEAGLRYAVARRPRWRAVHLACHGIVDTKTPLLSSLALAASGDDDGFLTAMDVLGSSIPSDLVVLSACRTGRGSVVRGEGVMGFVRAFMFAGSPRVLVSLWNGDDQATRTLMTRFHAALKRGAPTAAALAQAQAAVRSRPEWAHPYYWAGWVLWGLPD